MKALITGGTSGIGYGVACQLAELGWEVTIVGRDMQRGAQIAASLGAHFIRADLSLMSEVERLARSIKGSLDALIMCAGVLSTGPIQQRTAEGYEFSFGTNYLSRYVLSQMLLSKMVTEGCIVMVGGGGKHKDVSSDWAVPQSGMAAARSAALAVDLYAAELAKRQPQLRIHTCFPGVVKTNLLRDAPWFMRLYIRLLGSSIRQGSSYITELATQRHSQVHWNKDKVMHFSPPLPADSNQLFDYSQTVLESHVKEGLYAL